MSSHFKVKEYCPNVFRNLRERFGIEEQEYLVSICNVRANSVVGVCGSRIEEIYGERSIAQQMRSVNSTG